MKRRPLSLRHWRFAGLVCVLLSCVLTTAALAGGRSNQGSIYVRFKLAATESAPVEVSRLAFAVAQTLSSSLFAEFACAHVGDDQMVRGIMDFVRQQQWLSAPGAFEEDAAALSGDYRYLVVITADPSPIVPAVFVNIAGSDRRGPRREVAVSGTVLSMPDAHKLIDNFIDDFARLQVCPFKGEVSVVQSSTREKRTTTERPTFCNGQDATFVQRKAWLGSASQAWRLNKTGVIASNGTVKVETTEIEQDAVEDGCHACSSGRRSGGRVSEFMRQIDTRINNLSKATPAGYGQSDADAAVYLLFEEERSFYMEIRAASDRGTRTTTTTTSASGTCDGQAPTTQRAVTEVDASIEVLRLGPFPGKATDKHLKGKFETPLNNPEIGESGMRTVEFDLVRD